MEEGGYGVLSVNKRNSRRFEIKILDDIHACLDRMVAQSKPQSARVGA